MTASLLWLIPALPLAASLAGLLVARRLPRLAAYIAIGSLGLSLLLALATLARALGQGGPEVANFAWCEVGGTAVQFGFLLDPLTAFLCVMVTLVGLLIFIFSLGYMRDDPGFGRFFCLLSFFTGAMLGIVVANSLLLLFVAWELVGLASYLLIGFWFHRPEAAAAARKAFLTTRIGDVGLLLGLAWLNDASGTLLLYDGGKGVLENPVLITLAGQAAPAGLAASTAIGLLMFCGAIGKSGQFPLHVWLPDAMEGPTPVSALIHAATMVAAGVFLIARVFPLMQADRALDVPLHALTVVAGVGAITALLGACLALSQTDLKRVLAYSTVSQLGYMMLALGVGSWVAGIFHLLTHAFFKALLFLAAGSVIHATHHEQDIRRLGGLRPRLRLTFATFAVGTMALAGVPFLFSGFWSKEAILDAANDWPVSRLPVAIGLFSVGLTAFYSTRLCAEVFLGQPRSAAADHAHESPRTMTLPLVLLAAGSVLIGFLGTPAWPWLQAQLTGRPVETGPLLENLGLAALSLGLVGAGIAAGWIVYGRKPRTSASAADPFAARFPRVFALLAARLKIDEIYAATFGQGTAALAGFADFCDRHGWDGLVRLLSSLGEFSGLTLRDSDEQGLNKAFDEGCAELRGAGRWYSRLQTGNVQGYLLGMALAFAGLVLFVLLGGNR